jgi:hypothetical protein
MPISNATVMLKTGRREKFTDILFSDTLFVFDDKVCPINEILYSETTLESARN